MQVLGCYPVLPLFQAENAQCLGVDGFVAFLSALRITHQQSELTLGYRDVEGSIQTGVRFGLVTWVDVQYDSFLQINSTGRHSSLKVEMVGG